MTSIFPFALFSPILTNFLFLFYCIILSPLFVLFLFSGKKFWMNYIRQIISNIFMLLRTQSKTKNVFFIIFFYFYVLLSAIWHTGKYYIYTLFSFLLLFLFILCFASYLFLVVVFGCCFCFVFFPVWQECFPLISSKVKISMREKKK